MAGKILTTDEDIRRILKTSKTVAVLGLSTDETKDSHKVAVYLKENGMDVLPVRPDGAEILGKTSAVSVDKIDAAVDIVDVFRKPEAVTAHANEVLNMALKPKVFWMQLEIENAEAAELLTNAGIDVVMNKCIKIEHNRLIKENAC